MTTFPAWLFEQSHREDPVGDLAALVIPDPHYPGPQGDLADWRKYLDYRNDPPWALEALEAAWDEYQLVILGLAWEVEPNHA